MQDDIKKWGMPACLDIPIAARDKADIEKYIGDITRVLSFRTPNEALLVETRGVPAINERLPIWQLKESAILHKSPQVWVHVEYSPYKNAYRRAFPKESLAGLDLNHVMNRHVARLKGFHYLRIVPVGKSANRSSAFSEKWGIALHRKPESVKWNSEHQFRVQCADLADLVKMLNIKTGGTLQYPVNEAQYLIREPKADNGSYDE